MRQSAGVVLAAAGLALATAAAAQETSTLEISAKVPSYCVLTTAQASVDIGSLTNPYQFEFYVPVVLQCSAGTAYVISARGLNDDPAKFFTADHWLMDGANGVKYTVRWNDVSLQVPKTPEEVDYPLAPADGTAQSNRLIISVNKSNTPRVPGNYSDVLTVSVDY